MQVGELDVIYRNRCLGGGLRIVLGMSKVEYGESYILIYTFRYDFIREIKQLLCEWSFYLKKYNHFME